MIITTQWAARGCEPGAEWRSRRPGLWLARAIAPSRTRLGNPSKATDQAHHQGPAGKTRRCGVRLAASCAQLRGLSVAATRRNLTGPALPADSPSRAVCRRWARTSTRTTGGHWPHASECVARAWPASLRVTLVRSVAGSGSGCIQCSRQRGTPGPGRRKSASASTQLSALPRQTT